MCGIFGIVGKEEKAAQVVLEGLKKLEYRGYDSWGIAIKKDGQLQRERHVGKIGEATTKLPKASVALGHTRWATHGGVTEGNAHPHFDCSKKLCLVHNGIVENFLSLKENFKMSHQYESETDTEIALHLVEESGSLLKAYRQLEGMNALILLSADSDELVAVKNGSPLIVGLGKEANYISSDVWALLPHTNQVIFMEDGQAARISKDKVVLMDAESGKEIKQKVTTLDWQKQLSVLGKFHHYMEKEIYDQPKMLTNLADLPQKTVQDITTAIKKSTKTLLLGSGTASYAAIFGQYLLNFRGLEAEGVVATEFAKLEPLLNKDKTFIALSQSGETIDLIAAVDKAKRKGMRIIALTNVLGSTLYRKADYKLLLTAGQEVAVASTKAFVAKLAILIQLAYELDGNLVEGKELVSKSAQAVNDILTGTLRGQIKSLAKKLKDNEHMFAVGRGLSYPIAMETSIKVKEVSYIHAEAYPGGELKHGPIALIDKGMPCVVIAPNDDTLTDMISAAHEMKARGGLIIGLSPKKEAVFDIHLPVPDLKQATAIPMTAIVQLLAYDLAVARGLNPDKPRNLAKSVTVK
jgi:glucosamine--fructose-6-phosphate aminotransferase (isomerizing)